MFKLQMTLMIGSIALFLGGAAGTQGAEPWYTATADGRACGATDDASSPARWIEIQRMLGWTYRTEDTTDPGTGKVTKVILFSEGRNIQGRVVSITKAFYRSLRVCEASIAMKRGELDKYR